MIKKLRKNLKTILYLIIIVFLLIIAFFAIPVDWTRPFFLILAFLGLIFLILGILLILLGFKEKGKLKLYLLLTGFGAVCPLIFTLLHNAFYALAIAFEKSAVIFEPLHVISFVISIIISPIIFVIGLIGIFINKKKIKKKK